MKVLVTGATGNIGRQVVENLYERGAEVRALVRKTKATGFPAGVEVLPGDLSAPTSIREAVKRIDKLFLLNAVVPDELTQALIAYGTAKQAGIQHVTHLSVYKVEQFRDVPHFASKLAVESTIHEFCIPYAVPRPGYFFQNDLTLRPLLQEARIDPMPIGSAGISAIDSRDVAEAAAITLPIAGTKARLTSLPALIRWMGPQMPHSRRKL